jgi:hypothetical protein
VPGRRAYVRFSVCARLFPNSPVDRSQEPFRRINRRQLHQLMVACESGEESIYDLQGRWDEVEDNEDAASSVRGGASGRSSSSASVSGSRGSSAGPIHVTHSSSSGSALAAPAAPAPSVASEHFLLLDIREDDTLFRKCHIEGAMQYTMAMLRRDQVPPQLYKFVCAATMHGRSLASL